MLLHEFYGCLRHIVSNPDQSCETLSFNDEFGWEERIIFHVFGIDLIAIVASVRCCRIAIFPLIFLILQFRAII